MYNRKSRPLLTDLQVLNPQTGELETRRFREEKPRHKRNKDFYFMNRAGAELLYEADLGANDFRLLMCLISKCEWANLVHVPRKDLEMAVGMNTSAISRSFKRMEKAGFILRTASDPNRVYLFPLLCWRGQPDAVWGACTRFQEGRRTGTLPPDVSQLFGESAVELASRADL